MNKLGTYRKFSKSCGLVSLFRQFPNSDLCHVGEVAFDQEQLLHGPMETCGSLLITNKELKHSGNILQNYLMIVSNPKPEQELPCLCTCYIVSTQQILGGCREDVNVSCDQSLIHDRLNRLSVTFHKHHVVLKHLLRSPCSCQNPWDL